MRFSVVVPFRNTERFMDACIRSLLNQHYPRDRYEVLLIDNASTDGSAGRARRWPGVRVLHQPRIGSYAARNLGLQHASGEIIAFTDSDCAADPGWLAAMDRALDNLAVGVVLGHRKHPGTASALAMLEAFERHRSAWLFSAPESTRYYGQTNNMAVRESLFDQIGDFVEIPRGADVLWVQQAVRHHSHRLVCFAPDAVVHHLEMTSLIHHFRKKWIYGRSNRRNRGTQLTNRAVSHRDRIAIFRHTVAAERYGWAKTSALLLLLAAGGICYDVAARLPSLRPQAAPGAAGGTPPGPVGNEAIGGHASPADGASATPVTAPTSPSRRAVRTALRRESKS
jgi:glycosyltransferase involved in cell wall biosynthesis